MVRHLRLVPLYMALCLGANTVAAQDMQDLLAGDMRAMALHEAPQDVTDVSFTDADGTEMTLQDFAGEYVVLNFWATWCAPCREEMPSLNTLQQELGGDNFRVVTIASGRNPIPAINRFFEEVGVSDLPVYLDPRQGMTRAMGVFGLPTTVVLNPDGQEIGRLRGDADWGGEDALALMTALMSDAG
ncbi:TlpA family protein disulfide reductase [Nioella nitratireducens]|uniref:TlpA family protein disulfide reductase n=1 Tax=Nioella nitratireducens TaxID=1287720 RepID=UPI0008FD7398|nr:TlpA disulfide reductase family protein [Nioella nitratireducens]